jgi:glycerol-3-phosphate dehydrogenase
MSLLKTQVLVIGAGITGAGIARDLALRGVQCILVEKADINSGASGANHGLLHSGARYVRNDPLAATECREECVLLKKLASQCIEDTGGLFVAVAGDDENHIADFPDLCSRSGIAVEPLDIKKALEIEPVLSEKLIAAYSVGDASIDPFRLTLENIAHALEFGGRLLLHTSVVGFKKTNGRIQVVILQDQKTGKEVLVEADQVVNATGAWAGEIAALAGGHIDLLYSKGSLLITHHRIAQRVINRLRPSSDADILVPSGTVSILGTTSVQIDTPDNVRPTVAEIDYIIETASAMVPALQTTRYIRAYAGVRPLAGSKSLDNGRALSRGFFLIDHLGDKLENFVSIVGGKLTTYRLMAERTSDLICSRLAITAPCMTRTQPLPARSACKWTQPGLAARIWMQRQNSTDAMLCECEMVSKSTVDAVIESIHNQKATPDLRAVGRRSRVGKGTCQGAFCSIRILAHMLELGELDSDQGLRDLKRFLSSRWKGMRPILWDAALVQEQLQEAVHCGLFGLELQKDISDR